MLIDEFVRECKIEIVEFSQDVRDRSADLTRDEWRALLRERVDTAAKLEVDTKRSAKSRKEAGEMRARAEALGIALIHRESVEQYDTALSTAEARAAAAESKVADLEAELEELRARKEK